MARRPTPSVSTFSRRYCQAWKRAPRSKRGARCYLPQETPQGSLLARPGCAAGGLSSRFSPRQTLSLPATHQHQPARDLQRLHEIATANGLLGAGGSRRIWRSSIWPSAQLEPDDHKQILRKIAGGQCILHRTRFLRRVSMHRSLIVLGFSGALLAAPSPDGQSSSNGAAKPKSSTGTPTGN